MSQQRAVLELLANTTERRVGSGRRYFHAELGEALGLTASETMEVMWGLLARGLVYIDLGGGMPDNWRYELSSKGRFVLQGEDEFEPEDPDGYIERLEGMLPTLDPDVLFYTVEAVRCFAAGCYVAVSAMLGVASEKAVLLLGDAACMWLPEQEARKLRTTLVNPRAHFVHKFRELRSRLEPKKGSLPGELGETLSSTLDGVADLLRAYRNDAGHPTGRRIERADARVHLAIFPHYLTRVWRMRSHFMGG